MTTPGVDFFRVDRAGSVRRLLVAGVVMVAAGAGAIGAHLMHRIPEDLGHLVSLGGGASMIGGLVLTFGALAMILFENVYLAIRVDGLLVHDNGRETNIAWDELTEIRVDAQKGLVELRREKQEVLRWHAGKSANDVASRIEEAKRKAAHGLLRM